MLPKYYFKIKHIKVSNNAKADALSKKKNCKKMLKCQKYC